MPVTTPTGAPCGFSSAQGAPGLRGALARGACAGLASWGARTPGRRSPSPVVPWPCAFEVRLKAFRRAASQVDTRIVVCVNLRSAFRAMELRSLLPIAAAYCAREQLPGTSVPHRHAHRRSVPPVSVTNPWPWRKLARQAPS